MDDGESRAHRALGKVLEHERDVGMHPRGRQQVRLDAEGVKSRPRVELRA